MVVLDEPADLPEGTEVEVHPVDRSGKSTQAEECASTLYDVLEPVIGKAKGLPPDASRNVDHYLYGLPKK